MIARLKAVSYIPTVGNLGPTLTKGMNKGLTNLAMTKVEGGIFLSGTLPGDSKIVEAFIPDIQIEILQFETN